MNNYSVSLVGPAPWGFRLQGGKDFNMPLTISRLSDGGKAANANVGIGDIVLSIDGISADGMTHLEAQNKIKTCTGKLTMNLQRTPAAPKPDPIPVQLVEPKDIVKPVPIASAVVPKVSSATNMAFNKAPRPFGAVSSPKVTSIPSPSSAFTPAHASASSRASPPPLATVTPPTFTASGLHANAKSNPGQRSPILSAAKPAVNVPWQPTHNASFNENAQEVTEGQRRGFKENQVDNKEQNGPPRKHVVYTNTEFYHPPTHSNHSKKRLIEDTEDWHPRTGTTQSRSFRILAQITGTEHMKEPEPDHSKKTKDSQTENGDWSFSTALMNGLETQYSSSVATQTCEISDVSEQPVLLSTTQREEANSASSVLLSDPAPSTAASFTKLSGTALSISSFKRSNRIKTGSPVLNAPDAASLRVDGADHKRNLPVMISEATQTSELLVSPVAPVESALAAQSVKPEVVPVITDRKLPLENPLGSCLTLSAVTSTSLSSVIPSQVRNSAAAAVSTAVAIRARFSHQNTYRSLLDALLITPIIKPLPLESRPSRKSTSILDMQKNWTYDPLEPAQYTAATVKSMPENPENDVNRTASLSSASVPALKPAEPQYAVKTSGWQSSNQPAGSGWISNNSIGPGATVSSEKIAANVLTDEDTLVQRAEHIPAGKRTPMCAHCNQVIRGPFLVALGKSWHPEEFNCSHCKTSMAYIGFVEEKGALYCEGCYEKFFAPDCARCQRKILGEVINALKQTWHVSCFVCVACHKPIRNNVFHLEDGDPYCETDYYALFGTMCHGCEFPIEAGDRFLEALGHTWHDTCFVCSVCCDSLEGQTFFSKKDKPLCKKHAHSVNI
ncbi:PDZ and LIM domain protein 5 isoform X2 [Anolis carolinensis]|uniref:PDZ and LIM domain protein 5 isoform X2 n=1 Tax=Anolis carolinensis TaxID=28377 RepID=UPI000462C83B|nr:PREDICTED: PDZ and LIM domain protein 5 isoform X2 [Anolis carolinensis]|eukprot:XP_008109265.1 PREDICTED: PDZ and LIM domain protein 5 isoform X2 [Anolis carolinensis]